MLSVQGSKLRLQGELSNFQAAVNQATQNGIKYGQKINSGNWEFIFGQPKIPGGLPELFHGQPIK